MTHKSNPLAEWIASGALTSVDNQIAPTDEFLSNVSERKKTISNDDTVAVEHIRPELRKVDLDVELSATYLELSKYDVPASPAQLMATAVLLTSEKSTGARSAGAPSGFLPLHWEDASRLVELCDRCVVYVWRDNCDSCETMKKSLSDIFSADRPDDILAISIYGPDCATDLQREYDVSIGPTTLFTLNGSVDSRIIGAADTSAIRHEISVLQQRNQQ